MESEGHNMAEFFFVCIVFLVLSILMGLLRILLGPGRSDRMLVVQLFGTTGIAVLLLMARSLSMPELENIALVLALLAVMLAVTYNRRVAACPEDGR